MNKVRILLDMVKIEHTLFSMPFLYSGALLAARGFPSAWVLFWITIALFSARTAAMSLNRYIDWEIDIANPRTADRPTAAGLVTRGEVKALIGVSLAIFLCSTLMLNWLCVALYPLAVALFVIYPYLKRYTWFVVHIPLGMSLGIAPLGAWAAVTASIDIAPILLFFAVTFWVAGFDIIYATQDLKFDMDHGLHSIPSVFGIEKALRMSAGFHFMTVLFLALLVPMGGLGYIYGAGVGIIALLLAYEHSLVSPENLQKVGMAFFNVNVAVGLLTLLAVAGDVFL
jgi:4-hydroxybenzoate polyprenyltransferase